MKKIDARNLSGWIEAKKTKGLKAKPLSCLIADQSVLAKFLITTLEGNESLGVDSVVCVGESDDAWQQTPKALLKKYNVVNIDQDGWLLCEPKPENSVECIEILHSMVEDVDFYIIGLWGKETPEGPVQYGAVGDFICRQPYDHNDVWIVKRRLFLNTYSFK